MRNEKPFKQSPKKLRRSKREHSKSGASRSKRSKSSHALEAVEEDVSEKENAGADGDNAGSGKRRIKSEDAELGTPPRKRPMLKVEEGDE